MNAIQQIAWFFQQVAEVISNIWDFLRSILKFIYFAWRTIISLFVKITWFIVNSFEWFFDYLIDVLQQLGLYMGSVTEVFVWLFLFVITMIVFQFIFRVFTWKYAIFNTKKK